MFSLQNLATLAVSVGAVAASVAVADDDPNDGNGFTIQGRVVVDGVPLDLPGGTDFTFSLWQTEDGNSDRIGDDCEVTLSVVSGLFSTTVDVGVPADSGERWLAIAVDPDGPGGPFPQRMLEGRRRISSVPTAEWSDLAGVAANGPMRTGPDGISGDYAFLGPDRVGIWTTSPLRPLHVAGAARIDGVLEAQNGIDVNDFDIIDVDQYFGRQAILDVAFVGIGGGSGAGSQLVRFEMEDTWVVEQSNSGSDTDLQLRLLGGGSGKSFQIAANDGTVVFRVIPDQAIAVATQDFQVDGDGFVGGDLSVTGTVSAGAFDPPPSDRRLKTDVQDLRIGLDAVTALRPVRYRWAEGTDRRRLVGDRTEVGLIAQEVQEVLPDVVTEIRGGYLGVAYDRIVPILINAVREQQSQIEHRDRRIDELEARLARLESMILDFP